MNEEIPRIKAERQQTLQDGWCAQPTSGGNLLLQGVGFVPPRGVQKNCEEHVSKFFSCKLCFTSPKDHMDKLLRLLHIEQAFIPYKGLQYMKNTSNTPWYLFIYFCGPAMIPLDSGESYSCKVI